MKKSRKQVTQKRKVFGHTRLAWPVIDGLEATANQIGAPVALVRAVKRNGSKAFLTGQRVDTGILLPELFAALAKGSKLPEGIATPQDWLAFEKAKREEIKRKTDERETMLTADAVRQAGEAGGLFMSSLEKLARELPPALAGLPTSGVAARMELEIENIRRNLKIKMQEIGK